MKFFVKSFSVVLSVMLILSSLPMISFAATKIDGGYCGAEGNNLTYSLDSDGLLTITGTGKMADYEWGVAPWSSNNTDVKEITIENGVTSIGNYAFAGFSNVETVTIPGSVKSIGESAFNYCTVLEKITLPDGITSIGNYAFMNCSFLLSISIPDSVTNIGEEAFYGCESLKSVTIGKGLSSISGDAFSNCEKLTSITIDEKNPVLSGKNNCIIETASKTLIVGCQGSAIPDDGSVTAIGDFAFAGCVNLKSVTIPAAITEIGYNPFMNCSNLESITVDEKNTVYHSKNNCVINKETKELILGCKKSIIPDDGSVTSIGSDAFYGCSGLYSITIPEGVTTIGVEAFSDCSELSNITISDSVKTIGSDAFTDTGYYNVTENWENGLLYIGKWLVAADSETVGTSVSVKNGTVGIADYTFYDFSNITSVTIPDSVKSIGNSAFENCLMLTGITIPNGVTFIGNGAFGYCSTLANITIPDSVTSIGGDAFSETGYYNNSANWENGLLYIGKWLIAANSETMGTSVSIKDGTIGIAEYAFSWCFDMTDVTIPESVTSIGYGAFMNCSALTAVTIPKNVISIGDLAFYNCSELESITVDKNNTAYKSVNNCLIDIKNKVLMSGLNNGVIPDDGSVTSIGDCAFYGCSEIKSITIPACITSIGESAFEGCSKLESITVDKNNTVYKSTGNCLIDIKNKTLVLGCNNSVIPDDGSITYIADRAFSCYEELKSVTIPSGVTGIGDNVFEFCSELESVTIPDSVTSIGVFAFYCCTKLESITIPDNTTNIGRGAFAGCSEIESVTIPGSVINIYAYTFNGCSKLKSVIISDGVTSIGDYAFSDCSVLESITIPDSVTSIGDSVFTDCSANLTIKCYKDSYAAKYAVDNSIKYEYMHKHTWDNGVATKAATCKDTGIMTYTCTECKTTKTEVIAKTENHNFGEWIVKTAATYEADGSKTRTCSVCGKEETQTIAKLVASKSADDKTTGVQMNFAEGTFTESNVTLEVKTASKDTAIFKTVSNLKPNNNFEIFDISAMSGTTKVQPNGNVQITIPLPEKFDSKNVSIYYVNDKGEMEKLQSYVKDGKIVFETNHFSYYVVVDEATSTTLGDVTGDSKITAKDARAILRYSAKLDTFTKEQIAVSDVNNDGKVNAKDARKVLRVSAKLETM